MSYRANWRAYLCLKHYLWTLYLIHTHADFQIDPSQLRKAHASAPLTLQPFLFQAWERILLRQHTSTYGRRPKASGGCVRGGRRLERLQRNQVDGVTQIWSIQRQGPLLSSFHITSKYIECLQFQTCFFFFPPFSVHLFLSHSMIVELFWWLCWCVICCSFIDFNN